jgi:DNA-binding response OmpR family regulator
LRQAGFDVLAAENAAAARRLFSQSAEDIDLLLCNNILPDGNGIDLSRELQARAPYLRVF